MTLSFAATYRGERFLTGFRGPVGKATSLPERPRAMFALSAENVPLVFPGAGATSGVGGHRPALVAEDFTDPRLKDTLARTEILITGWGCPRIDTAVLDAAPKLRAVLHSAGSVKGLATPELWRRGIVVNSAAVANAVPVAEYTLAMILLAGKGLFAARDRLRAERAFPGWGLVPGIGNHGRRVGVIGVIGASRIGRKVIELLCPFDLPPPSPTRTSTRRASPPSASPSSRWTTCCAPRTSSRSTPP